MSSSGDPLDPSTVKGEMLAPDPAAVQAPALSDPAKAARPVFLADNVPPAANANPVLLDPMRGADR